MDRSLLASLADSFGLSLSAHQLDRFEVFEDYLYEANATQNLTRIPRDRAVVEHFADSLSLAKGTAGRVIQTAVDIGSGAGFPGVPLAIAFPGWRVTLLESLGKRCKFLRNLAAVLELKNVLVVEDRAEKAAHSELRETFDLATARAVAPLPVLLELSLPLIRTGGAGIYLKSMPPETEIEQSHALAGSLGGMIGERIQVTCADLSRELVVVSKTGPSDPRFPRSFQAIKRQHK